MEKLIVVGLMTIMIATLYLHNLSASKVDNDAAISKDQFSFPRWKNLHKLNTEILKSETHSVWFDLYVNKKAKKPYLDETSLMPQDSLIVKPHYRDQQRSEISKITIMLKMEEGYDTENGDWWYGVYDKTGMKAWHQGKIHECIKCHKQVSETDYMFSQSMLINIEDSEW